MADALRLPRHGGFVRCIFSHPVFPEQAARFRSVVSKLQNLGDFVSTPTLIELLAGHGGSQDRYFHLSFDDAFAGVYEVAAPILAEKKVPSIVFVPTALIDADYAVVSKAFVHLRSYRRPIRMMTWKMVASVGSLGMEVGSHTRTHCRLADISADAAALHREVAGSKDDIERATGRPCRAFAWPFGTMQDIDQASGRAILDAGYEIAFSGLRGDAQAGTSAQAVPRHQVEFHWPAF